MSHCQTSSSRPHVGLSRLRKNFLYFFCSAGAQSLSSSTAIAPRFVNMLRTGQPVLCAGHAHASTSHRSDHSSVSLQHDSLIISSLLPAFEPKFNAVNVYHGRKLHIRRPLQHFSCGAHAHTRLCLHTSCRAHTCTYACMLPLQLTLSLCSHSVTFSLC